MNIAVELVRATAAIERRDHENAIRRAVFDHKDTKAVVREVEIFDGYALATCTHTAYRGTVHARHDVPINFALKLEADGWIVLASRGYRQDAWKAIQADKAQQ